MNPRVALKSGLARVASSKAAPGLTVLVYHRVGGGTPDERDIPTDAFTRQLDLLADRGTVVALDEALDALDAGDDEPRVVLTFDDGFADVADPALGLLAERSLPFTVYVATAYVGGEMQWEGSTAKAAGEGLTWPQLEQLAASGLCTIGNHTHTHARPEVLSGAELDRCTVELESHLGITPTHFAYTWGISVPAMEPELRSRFRSVATGDVGRNHPGDDPLRLKRVPVRGTDPLDFFAAKLTGRLLPERTYGAVVATAKRVGVRA